MTKRNVNNLIEMSRKTKKKSFSVLIFCSRNTRTKEKRSTRRTSQTIEINDWLFLSMFKDKRKAVIVDVCLKKNFHWQCTETNRSGIFFLFFFYPLSCFDGGIRSERSTDASNINVTDWKNRIKSRTKISSRSLRLGSFEKKRLADQIWFDRHNERTDTDNFHWVSRLYLTWFVVDRTCFSSKTGNEKQSKKNFRLVLVFRC